MHSSHWELEKKGVCFFSKGKTQAKSRAHIFLSFLFTYTFVYVSNNVCIYLVCLALWCIHNTILIFLLFFHHLGKSMSHVFVHIVLLWRAIGRHQTEETQGIEWSMSSRRCRLTTHANSPMQRTNENNWSNQILIQNIHMTAIAVAWHGLYGRLMFTWKSQKAISIKKILCFYFVSIFFPLILFK